MGRLCVRIDYQALAERLSRIHGKPYSHADLHLWLQSQGFQQSGAINWFCDGELDGKLEPTEVLEAVREETINGVTFCHRETPKPGSSASQ